MKKISIILILVLVSAIFTGCSGKESVKTELNFMLNSSPTSADPTLLYDFTGYTMSKFFCCTLYEYNNKKQLVPALAESYELSDDGLTYTFHLKDDIKWSNGKPITAEDFVFSFKRLADPNVGSNSVYYVTDCCKLKNIMEIQAGEKPLSELGVYAPDNKTFVVELEEPCTYFLDLITNNNFSPINEEFFLSTGGKYGTADEMVLSCGPYILDRFEPLATQIHFTKNPYYYNSDSISLSGVNLLVIGNEQQALMCYETGMIDIMQISGELSELAVGDPEFKEFVGTAFYYIYINQRTSCEELKNRNIRLALSKSIDRRLLTEKLLKSGNTPITRIIPEGFYTETDGSDFAIDQNRYDEFAAYDPDAALYCWKQGLSELGISTLKLEFSCNSDKVSLAEAIKDQMEKTLPGLEVEIKGVPFKERVAMRKSGEYDLMLSNWGPDFSDPTTYLVLFLTHSNAITYTNEEYDRLYQLTCTAEMAVDPAARNRVLHQLEDILMEDAATIPLYVVGNTYLIRSSISGFQIPPTGGGVIVNGIDKEVG